jgi:hypothetical protein
MRKRRRPMANRPFLSKRIDELEQLFKTSGKDLLTLQALENELLHRSTPRAVGLLKAVRKVLSCPQFADKTPQPHLFEAPRDTTEDGPYSPSDITAQQAKPIAQSTPPRDSPLRSDVKRETELLPSWAIDEERLPAPVCKEPTSDANLGEETMTSDEACKILQVTLGSDWAIIETCRRDIVQRSHPEQIRILPPSRQRALAEHARRANEAIKILLGSRIH